MELFIATFARHAEARDDDPEAAPDRPVDATLFERPAPELFADPVSLSQMQRGSASFLQALADSKRESGDTIAADVLNDINSILNESGDAISEEEPSRRALLDYVYPVV